jgi:hypothetical protein
MGYKPKAQLRSSSAHYYSHRPQQEQYDEGLENAIQASLREQALYNANRRHHATTSFTYTTQGDIPYEAALAMAMAASLEPQQPTPAAQTIKKAPSQEVHNLLKGDEACPICASTIGELGSEQARFTRCCHQFICNDDVQELEKRAVELYTNMHDAEWRRRYSASPDFTGWPYALQDIEQHRHAECPLCRHYPLEVDLPAQSTDQHSGVIAPADGTHTSSRQEAVHQDITDIINLFFKFLDTVITKAVTDRNTEALRLLQQELTPWGNYEQFQALVHTILCVRPEIKLREHDIISTVWENILHTIPAIEREQIILDDTMHTLSHYEKRYLILTTDSIGSLLETWQAHLGDKGLHVWNMLNNAQKLFYLYRLKFQCQLADIIDHIA